MANETKSISELVAKAFSQADTDTIRDVMANVLREQMDRFDMRDIIAKSMTSFVSEVVKGLLEEPALREAMAARIKQQVLMATGNMTVQFKNERGY